jgi:hypothetical protein
MPQYVDFAIGDEIAHRSGGIEGYQLIFGGAIPRDDLSFDVQIVMFKGAGYAGMGTSFLWNVREGDRIRLGRDYRAYEEPESRRKPGRISALYFHKIERDHLTLSYDWI